MRAWQVAELGQPSDVMRLEDVPAIRPGPRQVRVRVLAAPANFPDALLCRGLYQVRPRLPFTPGVEMCGEVLDVGEGVTRPRVGDRVVGTAALPHGGFADEALLQVAATFPAPPALDDAEASAFVIGYQTGWFALHRRARIQAGETLLVHAAVVFDPVGGETYDRSTKCVAFEGRIVVVGFAGGTIQAPSLSHVLLKNYSVLGLHWGLYAEVAPRAVHECHDELTRLTNDGLVTPLVSERLALDEVAQGVQRLADGKTVGRLAWVADR